MKKIIILILLLIMCKTSSAQWIAIDTADINAIWLVQPNDGWSFQEEFKHWDGASWSVAVQDSSFFAQTCAFTAPNDGWVFGFEDSLYRFNGTGWTKLYSGMPAIGYCDFFDSNNGWALSWYYSYKYQNGTWTQYPINLPAYITNFGYKSISASDSNTAWIAGISDFGSPNHDTSYIFKFVANQWVIDTAIADVSLFNICFSDQNHGWAGGYNNLTFNAVIFKFNGNGWILDYQTIDPFGISNIYMHNNNLGWSSGESGILNRYNGINWSVQDTLPIMITQFSFVDPMNGWALGLSTAHVGPRNIVYSTTTGGLGVENISSSISSELVIFPNPTSGALTLQLPQQFGNINSLEIYNTLGQLQETPEMHTDIDISTYKNGLYFFVVTNDKGERLSARVVKE